RWGTPHRARCADAGGRLEPFHQQHATRTRSASHLRRGDPVMNEAPPISRYLPARREEIALLTSIPHTGTFVPADVRRQFANPSVSAEMMTDWHLHELYAFLPDLGIDVIHATHHRFVVDLNRPADSRPLYPGRFETTLVPTETFQGEPIWN